MAHGYRTLQHWNQWLSHQFLGRSLLQSEQDSLSNLLANHFGKHALLIGVPQQESLMQSAVPPCHSLLTPLISRENKVGIIEGDLHELPILTASVDLVLLPHTLEFVDNPRRLLAEACRVVRPEGLIAICGFNPFSAWRLKKILARQAVPWGENFLPAKKIKQWLALADFQLEQQASILYTPPVEQEQLYKKMNFMERLGSKCLPIGGGVYILLARAKVMPLTPIKLKWKQQLSGMRISTTISGHIARLS